MIDHRWYAGKTGAPGDLVAALTDRGFRVGTIKHDAHGFEMDRPEELPPLFKRMDIVCHGV